MDPLPTLTEADLFAHAITDMVNAISDRPGESTAQRVIRAQVGTHLILGLAPRGTIEVMLAGHAVMFHAVITDSVSNTLRGEIETTRRGTRANIVAMDRAFHQNLDKLEQYQARRSVSAGEAEPAPRSQEVRIAPVETMAARTGDANQDHMPQPVPSPATGVDQLPVAEMPASMHLFDAQSDSPTLSPAVITAEARDGQTDTIPFASLSANEDTKPQPRLNRAQRRQLRHGRMARQV